MLICIQGLPRRHLRGIVRFTQEAKGTFKMADSFDGTLSANQSCSFNCKWLPPMEATIFEAAIHSEQGGESNFSATPPRQHVERGPVLLWIASRMRMLKARCAHCCVTSYFDTMKCCNLPQYHMVMKEYRLQTMSVSNNTYIYRYSSPYIYIYMCVCVRVFIQ